MGRWIERRLVASEAATAPGRIALPDADGWFPALVPASPPGRVRGALCELELRPGELALLDRYEGPEYRRAAVPIRTVGDARVTAQLYLWRAALPRDAVPIRSGDFIGWLRGSGLNAFSPSPRGG